MILLSYSRWPLLRPVSGQVDGNGISSFGRTLPKPALLVYSPRIDAGIWQRDEYSLSSIYRFLCCQYRSLETSSVQEGAKLAFPAILITIPITIALRMLFVIVWQRYSIYSSNSGDKSGRQPSATSPKLSRQPYLAATNLQDAYFHSAKSPPTNQAWGLAYSQAWHDGSAGLLVTIENSR